MPVRPARLSDLEALGALFDGYRAFYGQSSDPERTRRFLSHRLGLADSHLLVHAGADGELEGFVQLYPLFSTVRLAPAWVLNDLFVVPEARERGVGRALMIAAQELAREHGVAQLKLATQVDNHVAQALYESQGWQRDRAFYHYSLSVNSPIDQEPA